MGHRWQWERVVAKTTPSLPEGPGDERIVVPWPKREKRNLPEREPVFFDEALPVSSHVFGTAKRRCMTQLRTLYQRSRTKYQRSRFLQKTHFRDHQKNLSTSIRFSILHRSN